MLMGRVRCSELHGPGVILLGDAAHAVTPIGGQGCNAALEDAVVLDDVLSETGILSAFSKMGAPGHSADFVLAKRISCEPHQSTV